MFYKLNFNYCITVEPVKDYHAQKEVVGQHQMDVLPSVVDVVKRQAVGTLRVIRVSVQKLFTSLLCVVGQSDIILISHKLRNIFFSALLKYLKY